MQRRRFVFFFFLTPASFFKTMQLAPALAAQAGSHKGHPTDRLRIVLFAA